jgi:dihydrodipicolinate synthase/N-acetylneuraminate lyase
VPIAHLKAWLALMGLPHGPVRAPLVPLGAAEEEALRRDVEALGLVAA